MAFPTPVTESVPPTTLSARETGAALPRAAAGLQLLLAPCVAAWLAFVAIGVLLHSPALRVYRAGGLPGLDVLRDAAYAFVPDALLTAPRGSFLGFIVLALYLAFVAMFVRNGRRLSAAAGDWGPLETGRALVVFGAFLAVYGFFSHNVLEEAHGIYLMAFIVAVATCVATNGQAMHARAYSMRRPGGWQRNAAG